MKQNPIYQEVVSERGHYRHKINVATKTSLSEQIEMYQTMLVSISKSKERAVEQAIYWERRKHLELYDEIDRLTSVIEHKFIIAKPSPWFYFKLFLKSLKAKYGRSHG